MCMHLNVLNVQISNRNWRRLSQSVARRFPTAIPDWFLNCFLTVNRSCFYTLILLWRVWVPVVCIAVSRAPRTQLIGGWFDIMLSDVLHDWKELNRNGLRNELMIGPWTHFQAIEDPSIMLVTVKESLRFFDEEMKVSHAMRWIELRDKLSWDELRWVLCAFEYMYLL